MMNFARKRPYPLAEGSSAAMIDRQPPKRPRPSVDQAKLSPADREAFERVAAVLQKPLSELYEGNPRSASINERVDTRPPRTTVYSSSTSCPAQSTQCDTLDGRQIIGLAEIDGYPAQPWTSTRPSGVIFEEHTPLDLTFNQWTDKTRQAPNAQLGNNDFEVYSCSSKPAAFRTSQNWSHEATADEPWVGVPTNFLTQTDLQDETIDHSEFIMRSGNKEGPFHASGATLTALDDCLTMDVRGPGQFGDITGETLSHQPRYEYGDLSKNNEKEPSLGQDWEEVDIPQVSGHGSQLIASMMTTRPDWSLIETPKSQEIDERILIGDNSTSRSVKWMSGDSGRDGLSPHKPQRRRPFQDQQLREETSSTRKLKACVRCRMQKIRCQINPNNPAGVCQTCQAVSKQKIHTLPCVRYKLTECIIYRTGKARGLEFTLRWPVMRLTDISEWSDAETRTIKVASDVCSIPLELAVRKFVPIPEDRLYKSWMDGTVNKFKETTPFAIVNMSATVKAMQDYINKHIFACMEHWLVGRDAWIQETYKFARLYMLVAPAEEAALLGDTFRLWFAIRRTATTEFIVGDETLDMAPETTDRSYPLFGKVPLPPVMIQQLDMILTLGFLQPLRKKFHEDFQRIILANKPKSWMTIYLITFISLTSCAAVTAEHYENARKHGLKRRYAMPNFISERHHSANVYLAHYHYCTEPCNPFTIDWRKRQTTPFAEMKPDDIHFLMKTSEMVKERKDKIRRINEIDLYEDDLYFVAQMFEENWMPRDIILDYSDETISGASLKSPAKQNSQA